MAKSSVAHKPEEETEEQKRLNELIAEHRKRKDEPLHLAISFPHRRHRKDICLFEVFGGFGDGQIDPKRAIFEILLFSNPNFRMPQDKNLRLFMTSPEELREALDHRWASLKPVQDALWSGQANVLFKDDQGAKLLKSLTQ